MSIGWRRFTRDPNPGKFQAPAEKPRYDRPEWGIVGYALVFAEGLGIFSLFSYCFYRSFVPFVFFPAFFAVYCKKRMQQSAQKRREQLKRQFRDGMLSISSALQIGYSLENAVAEAAGEMGGLWGARSDIAREFNGIVRKIQLNQPVEVLFAEFAERSGISEILLFAEVLRNAKRSGGNLIRITRGTAVQLGEKIRIEQEIQTFLAASRMQEQIMCAAPVLMLLYIQLTAPDLLAGMYHNLIGSLLMSVCLGIYLLAFWMIQHITRIPV